MRAVVGFLKELDDLLSRLRLAEKAHEALILEVPGDIFQGPQMVAGLVRRRDQQEEDIHRLSIKGGEIDPLARERDSSDQTIHGGVPGMGNGHALSDPSRAEFFTTEDGAGYALQVTLSEATGLIQTPHDLSDRLFFAGRLQVDQDCLTYHEIRKFIRPSINMPPGRQPLVWYIGVRGSWAVRRRRSAHLGAALARSTLGKLKAVGRVRSGPI